MDVRGSAATLTMARDTNPKSKIPSRSRLGVGIVTVRVAFGILTVVRLTNYQSTVDVLDRWTGGRPAARDDRGLLSPAAVTFSALTAADLAILLVGYRIVNRYLRERESAEAELLREKQFARSTVDALPNHIAILDANGVILDTNAAWRAFAAEKLAGVAGRMSGGT